MSDTAQPGAGNGRSRGVYRAYIMDLAQPLAPKTIIGYVKASKFGLAWKAARALVGDGKPHKEVPDTTTFYADEACTQELTVPHGASVVMATIMDPRERTPKLDKAKLQAIMDDESKTPQERLEAMQQLLAIA